MTFTSTSFAYAHCDRARDIRGTVRCFGDREISMYHVLEAKRRACGSASRQRPATYNALLGEDLQKGIEYVTVA